MELGGAVNALLLLPLKSSSGADVLPFCGFSDGKRLYFGAIYYYRYKGTAATNKFIGFSWAADVKATGISRSSYGSEQRAGALMGIRWGSSGARGGGGINNFEKYISRQGIKKGSVCCCR